MSDESKSSGKYQDLVEVFLSITKLPERERKASLQFLNDRELGTFLEELVGVNLKKVSMFSTHRVVALAVYDALDLLTQHMPAEHALFLFGVSVTLGPKESWCTTDEGKKKVLQSLIASKSTEIDAEWGIDSEDEEDFPSAGASEQKQELLQITTMDQMLVYMCESGDSLINAVLELFTAFYPQAKLRVYGQLYTIPPPKSLKFYDETGLHYAFLPDGRHTRCSARCTAVMAWLLVRYGVITDPNIFSRFGE